jgi:long-chain acyl-CoA synthetase
MLPNCAELLALSLAVSQMDCNLLTIAGNLADPTLAAVFKDSGARAFFVHQNEGNSAQSALKKAECPPSAIFTVGDTGGLGSYRSWLAQQPDTLPAVAKTAAATNVSPQAGDAQPGDLAEIVQLMALFDIQPEAHNVHFCGSPLHCPDVMLWAVNSLHYGHAVVLAQRWDAQGMLHAIDQYRVTTSYLIDDQFSQLLALPETLRARYNMSSTRHMMYSAAFCPPEVRRAMIDWWGMSIYQYSGAGATQITTASLSLAN